MTDFLSGLLMLVVMALIALVVTAFALVGFVGVGAIFARFTELTLFQATLLTLPVGMAILYLLGRTTGLPVAPQENEWDEWDEWEEWDEDVDFEDLPPSERRRILAYVVDLIEELDGLSLIHI